MITIAKNNMRTIAICASAVILHGCAENSYRQIYLSYSPDKAYLARAYIKDEGTLGSTRYEVEVMPVGTKKGELVFKGDNGDASPPVWISPAELVIPFCLGSVYSIRSVLSYQSSSTIKFRGRSSNLIHVHVVTAPESVVLGKRFCSPTTE